MGRPDDPGRQRRPGIDGLQDLRLRRWPRGHLGARGRHRLGPRAPVAGRPALPRRARAGQPAGRRADGAHLRQPGRAERQPRPAGLGTRHPRDLRAHGHERRGDRGAGGRRPHLRQGARRRAGRQRRARTRGGGHRAAGSGLGQPLRQRQGRAHHHQRHRGRLDADTHAMGQQLLRHPVRLRVGADEKPGRRAPVAPPGRRRRQRRARRARPGTPSRAHDDHRRPGAARGPGLRGDLAPLPCRPGGLCRRLRARLVQAHAPRHGAEAPAMPATRCRRRP
jgi:hypothetical protein